MTALLLSPPHGSSTSDRTGSLVPAKPHSLTQIHCEGAFLRVCPWFSFSRFLIRLGLSITALSVGGFLPFGPVEEAFSQILQTDWINPASGDWTVGTNWDNGVPDPTSGQAFIANGGTAIISGVQTSTFDLFLGEGSILSTGPNLPGNLLITNHGGLVLTFGAALGSFAPGSITVQGSSSLQIGQNLTFGFPGH